MHVRPCFRLSPHHPIVLVWCTALFFATLGNIALWKTLWSVMDIHDLRSTLFFFSLPVLLFCLFNLLFTPIGILPYVRKPVLALLVLISAACSYFMLHYGVLIDRDMVQNALETNQAEMTSYLSIPLLLTVLLLGALPSCVLLVMRTGNSGRPLRAALVWLGNVLATLMVLTAVSFAFYKEYSSLLRNNRYIREQVLPLNVVRHTYGYLRSSYSAKAQPLRAVGEDATRTPGKRPRLVVVVAGETARAQNFQLNGYPRPTNPYLSRKDNVISFGDVSSCGTATAVSLPCMFSQMTRSQYDGVAAASEENVLDILQRTGVSVLWRDNNNGGCKGVCERVPTDDMPPLKVPGLCVDRDGTCHDEILLHQLGARIEAMPGDGLIVLHQLGSHGPTYFERYPADARTFSPTCDSNQIQKCSNEALVNTYDNTLVYTDRLLGKAIDLLQTYADQRDVALIYVSDHGESLGEHGLYLHGTPYFIAPREQTQVPLVMWFSPAFATHARLEVACLRHAAGTRSYSHDNLFHSLLGLFDISSGVYEPGLDVFAGCRLP
ncbi:phosphoethanolamine transferase [Stenotrophomonas lactitubi]|uniref:phosphoethanolamine transferase n=1 Tax=Stenotrophomonas lactitubi TaxID=2045214 RepID=UPI0035C1A3CA